MVAFSCILLVGYLGVYTAMIAFLSNNAVLVPAITDASVLQRLLYWL